MRHKKEPLKMAKSLIYSALANLRGERGIRTPGTLRYDGFQDRCNRPLCHLSNRCWKSRFFESECKGKEFFLIVQIFL